MTSEGRGLPSALVMEEAWSLHTHPEQVGPVMTILEFLPLPQAGSSAWD